MNGIRTRDGEIRKNAAAQDKLLAFIYGHAITRWLLQPFIRPWFSKLGGWFLSSRVSCLMIPPFIRNSHIDMSQYEPVKYRSFNEFFSREIKAEARKIDKEPMHLIAPCDSKLTVYTLSEACVLRIKHTDYTLNTLLKNEALARQYAGGYALVFRLSVDDYHRYCYIDGGDKTDNRFIQGHLHTVNPIAYEHYPIFKENSREYSILHSTSFGNVLMMEVGALLVGKIVNHHGVKTVARGEEKGYFQFGGSTVVLMFEKDRVCIDEDLMAASEQDIETVVKMGERVGCKKQ